mmetsp:Transcript_80655/g.142095  ORF Transcript_80655/g.142095 Transcript_80655/m.142095 type:complete len:214 (-) Transcript_80655:523-1164(-)
MVGVKYTSYITHRCPVLCQHPNFERERQRKLDDDVHVSFHALATWTMGRQKSTTSEKCTWHNGTCEKQHCQSKHHLLHPETARKLHHPKKPWRLLPLHAITWAINHGDPHGCQLVTHLGLAPPKIHKIGKPPRLSPILGPKPSPRQLNPKIAIMQYLVKALPGPPAPSLPLGRVKKRNSIQTENPPETVHRGAHATAHGKVGRGAHCGPRSTG